MSAFIQKVLPAAMTNYRLHLALIKSYMLDTRSASKYPIDSNLRTIKDMNYVTDPGLYRLTKDTRNYCNPEDTSNQYWYEPTKDTTGLPSRSVAYAYIIPLTDDYIKQYALIGAEGHVTIYTRLGHKTADGMNWWRWRPYSDLNPSYELLQDTVGKGNTNYISFGNHELSLPDAKEVDVGTVIRLDQWKGNGRVYSLEAYKDPETGKISYHEKDTVDTEPVVMVFDTDIILTRHETEYTLQRQGMFVWTNGIYTIGTQLIHDKFFWSIYQDGIEQYRSESCIADADSPVDSRYFEVINDVPVTDHYAHITLTRHQSTQSDDVIDTCNTYEFEVMNDHDPYNSKFNYWCLFVYNTSKDATAKLAQYYNQTLRELKQDIVNIHSRITDEVTIINNTINVVSNNLVSYVDSSIVSHNYDIEAHPYILALISAGSGSGGSALASHMVDPHAHENRFAPFMEHVAAIEANVNYVSTTMADISAQVINYTDYTSADISQYVALLSGGIYVDIYSVSGDLYQYTNNNITIISTQITNVSADITQNITYKYEQLVSNINLVSQDLTTLSDAFNTSLIAISTDLGNKISIAEYNLSNFITITSGSISDYIDTLSWNIVTSMSECCDKMSSLITVVSGDLSTYVDATSYNLSHYIDYVSASIIDYVDHLPQVDPGVVSVYTGSGLSGYTTEDHHSVYISGVEAGPDAYGMVYVTSEVVSLADTVESRYVVVPDTNAVYHAVGTVSNQLSQYIDETSGSITSYIFAFSSEIYEYIDTVDSGIIAVSTFRGLETSMSENGRIVYISGLPATSTSYGMTVITDEVVSLAEENISSEYTVPNTNAVWSMGENLRTSIAEVSGELASYMQITSYGLSTYIDATSKDLKDYIDLVSWHVSNVDVGLTDASGVSGISTSITADGHTVYISGLDAEADSHGMVYVTSQVVSLAESVDSRYVVVPDTNAVWSLGSGFSTTIYTVSTDLSNTIFIVSQNLTTYVDVTSADISSYVASLSGSIYDGMVSCCDKMTSLIYLVSHDLSTFVDQTSYGLSTYTTEVSNDLSSYVATTSQELKDYIDQISGHITSMDVGLTDAQGYSGISTTISPDGHTVSISGLPAASDSYGMVYTHETLDLITDETSGHAVPTVNAISQVIALFSADVYNYIDTTSAGLSEYITTVSSNLSNTIYMVSQQITDFIDSMDYGVAEVQAISGLSTANSTGPVVTITGELANPVSYGMVYITSKVVSMPDTVIARHDTVPDTNAVYEAIGEASAKLEAYTSLVSGQLSSYVKVVSQEIIDYIDGLPEVDPGVVSVFVSSGLSGYTTANGHSVYISGLPATELNYGMVYAMNDLTSNTGDASGYSVPTVHAVSLAITLFSADVAEYISLVSGQLVDRIDTTSKVLNNTIYLVSRDISAYIDQLDTGVAQVNAISGLLADNPTGPVVTISGLHATDTSYGMVYVHDNINLIQDATKDYTVPTVNAVSRAIVSAIYTQIPPEIRYITSTIFIEIGSQYIPWDKVADAAAIEEASAHTFGAALYKLNINDQENQMLYVYNNPAAVESFGVVQTIDSVIKINDTVDEHIKIDPRGDAYIHLDGNPGDKYIVPTVNAVHNALMELSAKIPEVISSTIYVVSEVYNENHYYDYHTEVTQVSQFYITNVSEYHLDQIVTINTYSGLTHDTDGHGGYNISGTPATYTTYGMVTTHSKIETIYGPAESYTVPTVNAVSNYGTEISNLITIVSRDIIDYIDNLPQVDPGVVSVYVSSGLEGITMGGSHVSIHGLPASTDSYGMVYTHNTIETITTEDAGYVVPTVNAVSRAIADLPVGVEQVKVESGLKVSGSEGPIVTISGMPATPTVYGMVYVTSNVSPVAGDTRYITIPNVNAVYDAVSLLSSLIAYTSESITETIYEVSGGLETFTSRVSGELHTFVKVVSQEIIDYIDNVGFISEVRGISGLSVDDSNGPIVTVSGLPANTTTSYGMVYTQETLTPVTGDSSSYTVPTVNAVSQALTNLGIGVAEVDVFSGLHVVNSDGPIVQVSGLPANLQEYGMVYVTSTLTPIEGTKGQITVPDVNTVYKATEMLSSFIAYTSSELSNTIFEVSGELYAYINLVSQNISGYIDGIEYISEVHGVNGLIEDNAGGPIVTLSGLPANSTTSYGMVYTQETLNEVTGSQSAYTVPTVNAVSKALAKIEVGVMEVDVVSGLKVVGSEGPVVTISGLHATPTEYGMVYVTSNIAPVTGDTQYITIPDVNAIYDANCLLSSIIMYTSEAITNRLFEVSGGLELFISSVSGELSTFVRVISKEIADTIDNLEYITEVNVYSGLTVDDPDGPVVNVSGLPTDTTSYGMVKTIETITYIEDASSVYVVPTVNAVSRAIAVAVPNVSGVEPVYVKEGTNAVSIGLHYTDAYTNGVRLTTTNTGTSKILKAEALTANGDEQIGTVKTVDTITWITGDTSLYTVPTVNAVSLAIALFSGAVYYYIDVTSNALVNLVETTSNRLSNTIYTVSKDITDYIDQLDTGITQVKASSGLTVDNSEGPVVTVSGLPTDTTSYGMVKSIETITWISDPSSTYVVPTVNAVSKAITEAIYAMPIATSNTYGAITLNIVADIARDTMTSGIDVTSFTNLLSNYVPWDSIKDTAYTRDVTRSDYIHTLGANFYIEKHDTEDKAKWDLYTYNEYADGVGWYQHDGKTADNLGVVTTWDRVSRIDVVVDDMLPITSNGSEYIHFHGNPGDKWVVPTVNAVYDALQELSAKIPVITSKTIYIVSEVYVENHNYDYHTEITQVSQFYNTYVSEFHFDQMVDISTYSGITHTKEGDHTYHISGLPADSTNYGMVIAYPGITTIEGFTSTFTVPTVNAVSRYGADIRDYVTVVSRDLSSFTRTVSQEIIDYIDSLPQVDPGVVSVYIYSGLTGYTTEDGRNVHISGDTATATAYGMVYTQENLTEVTGAKSAYTVPTVNAVSNAIANLDTGISEVKAISGLIVDDSDGPIVTISGLNATTTSYGMVYVKDNLNKITGASSGHTVPTINAVSKALADLNTGISVVKASSGLMVDDSDGPTVTMTGLPGTSTSYGMAYIHENLELVIGMTSAYTVPTVNAVSRALTEVYSDMTDFVCLVSTQLKGTIDSVSKDITDTIEGLDYITEVNAYSGLTVDDPDGPVVNVSGLPANTTTSYGMVYTQESLTQVTGTKSAYTVPTVNAVSKAIANINTGIITVKGASGIDVDDSDGPNVVVSGLAAAFDSHGMVYVTSEVISLVETDAHRYTTVPDTNAVWNLGLGITSIVYIVSRNITDAIEELDTGITTVKASSGLTVNDFDGPNVTVSGLPADSTTSYGMVYTQENLNQVTGTESAYTVPTVNAVSRAIAGSVPNVSGIEPVYVSSGTNAVSVGLHYSTDYSNGVRLNYKTVGTAKYLIAEGKFANYTDVGTVKTINEIAWIEGASASYVVPTVNAVSTAITSAIYAMPVATSNTYGAVTLNMILGIVDAEIGMVTSMDYTSMYTHLSAYIPWEAVVTPEKNPMGYNLGANFFDDNHQNLFVYNEFADGAGWQRPSDKTLDNFGTVITWDRVSRINEVMDESLPLAPWMDPDDPAAVIHIAGNPGDMFVVPTVNAVYDALQELSAKIPVITSKEIYIVSEMYVENHNYDYHTEVTQVSNYYNTYVSEFHFDQVVTIATYSGISHTKQDDSSYSISGLPATSTEYGMVIAYPEIETITGVAETFTVPTVNAVSKLGTNLTNYIITVSNELSTFVKVTSQEIIDYIDGLPEPDPGLVSVFAGSGLSGYTTADGKSAYISGTTATNASYGMVYVHNSLDKVTGASSSYTVPTVNAVSHAIAILDTGISIVKASSGLEVDDSDGPTVTVTGKAATAATYGMVYVKSTVDKVTDGASGYTVPTVNAVSKALADLNTGISVVRAVSGLLVDDSDGPTVTVSGLAANGTTSYGMVYTQETLVVVAGETSKYTVPTANAVIAYVGEISNHYGEYLSDVSGIEPVYVSSGTQNVSVGLHYSSVYSNGVKLNSKVVGTQKYLFAEAKLADAASVGVVKAVETIDLITNASSSYTVPTVNAVSKAIMLAIYAMPLATDTTYGAVTLNQIGDIVDEHIDQETYSELTSVINKLSNYVPWDSVQDVDHITDGQYNLGANLLIYKPEGTTDKSRWNLLTYNGFADGIGWQRVADKTVDNFGTVITCNSVDRINTTIEELLPFVPGDETAPAAEFAGNPGDAFVVPTVNAVADALAALEAMIPESTTEYVYIVSEVYVENHNYDYHTETTTTEIINHTHVSEFHIDQNVVISTYSGIASNKINENTYHISGLPATSAEYGMVIVIGEVRDETGLAGNYTVPTAKAVWDFVEEHQGNTGITSIFVDSGLSATLTADAQSVYISGVHASTTVSFGMVYTQENLTHVTGDKSAYTVPTVNAVSKTIADIDTGVDIVKGISGLIVDDSDGPTVIMSGLPANTTTSYGMVYTQENLTLVTNAKSSYTVPTVNAVSKAILEAMEGAEGSIKTVKGTLGLTVDDSDGPNITMSGLPANTTTSYGMVYTQENLTQVTGAKSAYTVPTVNAVSAALADASMNVSGISPIYVVPGDDSAGIGLHWGELDIDGVKLTIQTVDGVDCLTAIARHPGATDLETGDFGTVRTSDKLVRPNAAYTHCTVPTLDALIDYLETSNTVSIGTVNPIYMATGNNVALHYNTTYRNGVRATVTGTDLIAEGRLASTGLVGTVQTLNTIEEVPTASEHYTVPTVNAVSRAIASITGGIADCVEPIYTTEDDEVALRYNATTLINGVGLYEDVVEGQVTLGASADLAHWNGTSKYPGTVMTENTIQSYNITTQEYGHAKYMHMVPTMNALYEHANDTTKHGAGRYTAEAVPIYRNGTTLSISSATAEQSGAVRITNTVINDTSVVPTAQAVYNALAGGGGGGSKMSQPQYGSAYFPGGGGSTVGSGTAGPNGGWLVISIAFAGSDVGCVGVSINDHYIPLAYIPNGCITQFVPLPSGASWTILDGTGGAASISYTVL